MVFTMVYNKEKKKNKEKEFYYLIYLEIKKKKEGYYLYWRTARKKEMDWKKNKEKEFAYLISLETKRKKDNQWRIRIMNYYKLQKPQNYKVTIFTKWLNQYNLQARQNHKVTVTIQSNQLHLQAPQNYKFKIITNQLRNSLKSKRITRSLIKLCTSLQKSYSPLHYNCSEKGKPLVKTRLKYWRKPILDPIRLC
jgi:hypothetical protein